MMKFSELWLSQWVNSGKDAKQLGQQFSQSGLGITVATPVAAEFTHVFVGQVVKCGRHPDADKLQVTKVDVGGDTLVDIVCGAKNCRQGIKVAVAVVGAVLPGDFQIKATELRGQPSNGMLCSEAELGLADSAPGIMELPENAQIGTNFREFLNLDDLSINIDLAPSRSDCSSMIGIAREVAALNGLSVTEPTWPENKVSIKDIFNLGIEDDCVQYLGRVVKGINTEAVTPLWMVEKLRRSGIAAISTIVDVLNFVELEFGFPVKALDIDKYEDDKGVINAQSTNILLHNSYFNTDDNLDPQMQSKAIERATALLLEIVGGKAGPVLGMTGNESLSPEQTFTLDRDHLNRFIGININAREVDELLTRFGFIVDAMDAQWATLPRYRSDIKSSFDLIGEVARIYGYQNIQNNTVTVQLNSVGCSKPSMPLDDYRNLMIQKGYFEAVNSTVVDLKLHQLLYPDVQAQPTPQLMGLDKSVLRFGLLPSLLSAAALNQEGQRSRVRLFETGAVFAPDSVENGPYQRQMNIAGVISGSLQDQHWAIESRNVDFYDVKGDVESLLSLITNTTCFDFEVTDNSALHPGQSAMIVCNEKVVGYLGTLHPNAQKGFGLTGRTFIFELNLDALFCAITAQRAVISKFPASRADLSVIVSQHQDAGKIISFIEKVGVNQLVDLKLFDVDQGKDMTPGFKSLGLSLTLQDVKRTLEDKDITVAVDTVVAALTKEFNVLLRE
jgi:phenylalanyl-tRNA synthetase beta chain